MVAVYVGLIAADGMANISTVFDMFIVGMRTTLLIPSSDSFLFGLLLYVHGKQLGSCRDCSQLVKRKLYCQSPYENHFRQASDQLAKVW